MKRVLSLVVLLFVVVSASADDREHIASYWYDGLEEFDAGRFIPPDVCSRCHADIHEMWSGTLHNEAFNDVLFRAATKLFVEQADQPAVREDAEHCVSCHNPIAYRSGQIPGSSADYSAVNEVTKEAISCDLCHTVSEAVHIRNASINTSPGKGSEEPGTKRGPRDDPQPFYHEAEFSKLHTSAEFCGACHNVTHVWYMTKLEGTYDEWYHSPYNSADPEKRVVCQDCHMRQTPGNPSTGMTERPDYPGSSASMGPERPHIYRHSVAGANTLMPELLGLPDARLLAEERLKHAAVIEVREPVRSDEGITAVVVRVRNEGAGHMLPTGVTEFRQMWLEVTVTDGSGEVVYKCGGCGPDNALLEDTHIFHTLFGDEDGNPTINVSKAAMMLNDHRIHPKGWSDEVFVMPEPVNGPVTVSATLKYRSMEPSLVETLLGEETAVPVITMTEGERSFD